MLTSLALIFLSALLLGALFQRLRFPSLVGMLLAGLVLGPYCLNLINPSLLAASADLRQIALVIILARAGLALRLDDLRQAGRPALLLCFLPACLEIAGFCLFGPRLLGVTTAEAALMGTVTAAVSPAVIVPRMLKLIEQKRGTASYIPQMIMAGAAVDDIFVLILFSAALSMAEGAAVSPALLAQIPIALAGGILAGLLSGGLLAKTFHCFHIRDSSKTLLLLSASFLLLALERAVESWVSFSGLLAVMALGAALLRYAPQVAARLSGKLNRLWVAAEILLFVLVGATVDLRYALAAGPAILLLLLAALSLRCLGVFFCLLGTGLSGKERLFCTISYLPKATVQAAIGGIPLAMGLPCGSLVLAVAVLSILLTAPLGALGIDLLSGCLLDCENAA